MGKAFSNNPSGVDSRCARKDWTGDPTRVWNARRLVSLQIRTNPTTPAVGRCTYSSGFKLQIVLEALQSDGTDAEVAEVYNAHPASAPQPEDEAKEKRLYSVRRLRQAEEENHRPRTCRNRLPNWSRLGHTS